MPRHELTARVLARLDDADQRRARLRRRQRQQQMLTIALATLVLLACLGPETSNAATRSLALALGAVAAWKAIVGALLGGLAFLPLLSAACLVAVAALLWQRLLYGQHRGLR